METVHVFLKDYAGRDFGGDFEAIGVSTTAGKLIIDLHYCGAKSKKRLSSAAVTIDLAILDRLNAEQLQRG